MIEILEKVVVGAFANDVEGVYLPIEHECPAVRVYDLHGKLIEVL